MRPGVGLSRGAGFVGSLEEEAMALVMLLKMGVMR